MSCTAERRNGLPLDAIGLDIGEPFLGGETRDRSFDFNCELALLAETIGTRKCPTSGRWAVYTIGGAVVAALTGECPLPPGKEVRNIEEYTWIALQQAVQDNPEKLDLTFTGAVLRNFFPRERETPPARPYRESRFLRHWESLAYPDINGHSVSNIQSKHIKQGHEAFESLPDEVKDSVCQVALYMPAMLDIAVSRIHTT